jgi:hypothetical protein
MKKNNSENNANPCPVDSSYELNITSQAKEAVFIFTDDWKPDSSVKQCEFLDGNGTQCDTLFSFFARKHHCRRLVL